MKFRSLLLILLLLTPKPLLFADRLNPYRTLSDFDFSIMGCGANPRNFLFLSKAELTRAVDAVVKNCSFSAEMARWGSTFISSFDKTGIDFSKEALVLLSGYYGSGSARSSLGLLFDETGALEARVSWHLPKGQPATPDTALYRFAIVVDKEIVKKVRVTVGGAEVEVFSIAPQ